MRVSKTVRDRIRNDYIRNRKYNEIYKQKEDKNGATKY